jgi:hypothetical protein
MTTTSERGGKTPTLTERRRETTGRQLEIDAASF